MESATFTLRVFNRKTGKDEDRRVMVTWKAEALARQYARKALANKSHKARVAHGCVVVTIVDGK